VAPRVSLSRTPTQEAYFSKLCKRFGATAAGREQPSTTPASATEPQEVRTPMRERERERGRAAQHHACVRHGAARGAHPHGRAGCPSSRPWWAIRRTVDGVGAVQHAPVKK
jgi:hypothetical protein